MSGSPYRSNLVDVVMDFMGQSRSGLAWRMRSADGETVFLPKSAVELDPPDPNTWSSCTVTMPRNLAEEKGLV